MQKYTDRTSAGKMLAAKLNDYQHRDDLIILALPRGGVPVGFQIAKHLHAPLDVFIVRKLGVPEHKELAMGAIATGGAVVYNHDIIQDLHIPQQAIDRVQTDEMKELHRREMAYRGHHDLPDLTDKTVILVDDGIATGATLRAAIKAVKQLQAKKIVVAVPVADIFICEQIQEMVDELVCPMQVTDLGAVGSWYESFSQTEDEEVHACLEAASKMSK